MLQRNPKDAQPCDYGLIDVLQTHTLLLRPVICAAREHADVCRKVILQELDKQVHSQLDRQK